MMEISVVMPAYREADNLKKIIPRIQSVLSDINVPSEILVIDTMEPMDNAEEVCSRFNAVYINRMNGNFYGDAIRTGISSADGKYIVIMDSDGSHNPEDIKKFYNEMKKENYDLIIGSRYCKGGETDNNFILRFMSYFLNVTYRVLFSLKVKDVSDSYRMYNAQKLKSIELKCDNFDIVEEILIKLNYSVDNFKVKEIPIKFSKRDAGESKRNLMKFIFSYIKTIRNLKRITRESRKKNG